MPDVEEGEPIMLLYATYRGKDELIVFDVEEVEPTIHCAVRQWSLKRSTKQGRSSAYDPEFLVLSVNTNRAKFKKGRDDALYNVDSMLEKADWPTWLTNAVSEHRQRRPSFQQEQAIA